MTPTDISAKIIADSISESGDRLTTMELEYPRFILAEFNTHRTFSRNTASSRAIPTAKIIERVRDDPAMPFVWGRNQPGMQAGEPLSDTNRLLAKNRWLASAHMAAEYAEHLAHIGAHKQIVNRILEPYMWVKTIVSSTEWDNFFDQRISPAAQPEMRILAERMRDALDGSRPELLRVGHWHLPYLDDATGVEIIENPAVWGPGDWDILARRVSVARCARVSYLNHDGVRDIDEDSRLYAKLLTGGHWSPFEHVATPSSRPYDHTDGNFAGWVQLRHLKGDQ